MHHYFEAITNNKGDALTGYYVRLVDSGGAGVTLYADTSLTPIVSVSGVADAAKVDADGNVDFYVAVGTYTLNIYATDSTTLVRSVLNVGMNIDMDTAATAVAAEAAASASASAASTSETNAATSASTALATLNSIAVINNATAHAETRTVLAALNTALGPAYLAESGRSGTFVWSSANNSTLVTADTAQGVYVAPASDTTGASGAWVRQFSGPIVPQWFGALADDDTGSGTDNSAAFTAMVAVLHARAKAGITNGTIYRGGDEILIAGRFYAGAFTFEPLATLKLRGIGGIGWGAPSRIRFDAGVTALRAQSFNTSGTATVDGGNHFSGDNWVVEDIYFLGPWNVSTTTEGEYYGLHVKRPIQMTNCTIDGFQGGACWIDSTTGLPDMCRFVNVKFLGSRTGLKATGGDANACTFTGCEFNNNRTWGVNDTSFLGNYYWGCHAANNGITSLASTLGASVVSYLGNRYAVIDGQDVGASTNAPSGTATDNTWWYYMLPGGTSGTGIPAWVSGMAIRAGGAYRTHNANATNHVDACYSESGQGPSQFTYPTMVNGGALASGVRGNPAYTYNYQGWWRVGGRDSSRGIIVDGDSTVNGGLTVDGGTGNGVLNVQGTGSSPTINLKESGTTYGYLLASGSSVYLNGSSNLILRVNGADTLALSTTSALIKSGSFGYGTGAGGAVTQATSKATGVTLNKATGQITLNGAALAGNTAVSFTFTNSVIAANDVVRINAGGAATPGSYLVQAESAAAGSCTVSIRNLTAGSLSEALVLNFVVLKGAIT